MYYTGAHMHQGERSVLGFVVPIALGAGIGIFKPNARNIQTPLCTGGEPACRFSATIHTLGATSGMKSAPSTSAKWRRTGMPVLRKVPLTFRNGSVTLRIVQLAHAAGECIV